MFVILYRKVFLYITAFIVVGGLLALFGYGLKPSIDFTGGSLTEVSYNTTLPEKSLVEEKISELDLGGFSVRESQDDGGRDGYLIRTRDLTDEEREVLSALVTEIGEGGEVTRFTSIGPVIGQELRDKAVWAIAGVSIIIMLYVAFAFAGIGYPVSSWVYASITIFILIHDVLVPAALVSILGHFVGMEADVLFVMALLAVLGYSVNDTIVVFDRVRENLKLNRIEKKTKRNEAGIIREDITYTLTKPYEEIVGSAVTQSMARSINTSLTTLLTLIALYIIGGAATQTFALVLIAGVVAGTYSSICIATPMLVTYAKWQESKKSVS
ncbi:MAG: protein translocase subunit SecF [Candidatus Paceibacterota bacterium]